MGIKTIGLIPPPPSKKGIGKFVHIPAPEGLVCCGWHRNSHFT